MEIWIAFITLLTSASVSIIRTFERDTGGVTLACAARITARIVEDDPVNYHGHSLHLPFKGKHIGGEVELILFHHKRGAAITNIRICILILLHGFEFKFDVPGQDRKVHRLATPDSQASIIRHILEAVVTGGYTTSSVRPSILFSPDSGNSVAADSDELIGGGSICPRLRKVPASWEDEGGAPALWEDEGGERLGRMREANGGENQLFKILDGNIICEGNTEELQEAALLAKRCLNVKGEDRPTMKEVAMELSGLRRAAIQPWTNNPEASMGQ
nr:putative wall-associated receptor kinase-like 16 [Ipomoea batatas]